MIISDDQTNLFIQNWPVYWWVAFYVELYTLYMTFAFDRKKKEATANPNLNRIRGVTKDLWSLKVGGLGMMDVD